MCSKPVGTWDYYSAKAVCTVRRFDFPRRCACTNEMPTFCWMCWIDPLASSENNSGGTPPLENHYQHTHIWPLMRFKPRRSAPTNIQQFGIHLPGHGTSRGS